ncbi:hypothetical protein L9F63_000663 [Diploptera punctata]|uniref:Chloride intracellular channel n=1 Tax=Diploptera punctata TaxID=6984 RepID=A0AAD8ES65_DIPPU|nr:hypothetical protein L9F63_000663 [Diploptera punctata]
MGACLECQSVHFLSKIKSLQFQSQLVCLENPPLEFSDAGFQHLPALLHSDGSGGTDRDVLNEIESKYPGGILNPDSKDLGLAENVTKNVYPLFCEYMQNTDISRVLGALQALDNYLSNRESNFLLGSEISLLDCIVLPQLHEIRVVMERVKDTPVPDGLRKLWMYLFHGYQKTLKSTCPNDMEICLAWTQKLGLPASIIKMPEWLPQEHHGTYHSFNIPNLAICPARCPRREQEEELIK